MTVRLCINRSHVPVSDVHGPSRGVLAKAVKHLLQWHAWCSLLASALHPLLLCPCVAARGSVQLSAAADRMPFAGTGLKPLTQS
jgi:hypothetical protein